MSARTPEQVMRAWFEEIWSEGRDHLIEALMAPGIVSHRTYDNGGDVIGPEGFRSFYDGIRGAFSDLRFTIEDVFACGTKVVGRWTVTGSHTGAFQGLAPTGRSVAISGMAIAVVEDGMVRESWDEWDRLGLMVQLGMVPALA